MRALNGVPPDRQDDGRALVWETIPARDPGAPAVAHIDGAGVRNGGRFGLGDVLIQPRAGGKASSAPPEGGREEVAFLAAHECCSPWFEDETPAGYRSASPRADATSKKSLKR